jgi:transposase InsO family protein
MELQFRTLVATRRVVAQLPYNTHTTRDDFELTTWDGWIAADAIEPGSAPAFIGHIADRYFITAFAALPHSEVVSLRDRVPQIIVP